MSAEGGGAGLWPERVDSRKLKVEYGVLTG